jgi:hypothetical protein
MNGVPDYVKARKYSWDLILLSIAVVCYLAARACVQSVTIDEADCFMTFATGYGDAAWYPSAQNHVLNTLLERLSWSIFGFNQVAMRLPALLGAVIYMASAISICGRLTGRVFRLVVFVCLVGNPFVLDYLVAARGYSLAVAFLLGAVAVYWGIVDQETEGEPAALGRYALASVFLGLSFAANFSFAIADGLAGVIFLVVAGISYHLGQRSRGKAGLSRRRAALEGICGTLPGVGVAFFLCGSTLVRWHSGEFVYGAHHLAEMWKSLSKTSFPVPNPEIVNPLLNPAWARFRSPLLGAAIVFLCLQLVAVVSIPRIWAARQLRSRVLIAIAFSSIVLLAVALHWAALRVAGLLLPEARTGLFFVPLLTLLFATTTDVLRRETSLRRAAIPGLAILAACGVYFLGTLRLHYFQEWRFNEDTKNVFWVMREVERRCGIHEFVTEWHYVATLNFYRLQYENQTMKPFFSVFKENLPKDKNGYIVYYDDGEGFIKQNQLAVWYHNWQTGATVAVRACPVAVRE